MKGDQISKMASQAMDGLVAAVEAGKSEKLKMYLAMMGRFHGYSPGNQLLIGFQRPDATRVAGYGTWLQLGRRVKRGQKAIRILAPIVWRTKDDDDEDKVVSFRSACITDTGHGHGLGPVNPILILGLAVRDHRGTDGYGAERPRARRLL